MALEAGENDVGVFERYFCEALLFLVFVVNLFLGRPQTHQPRWALGMNSHKVDSKWDGTDTLSLPRAEPRKLHY
jgi:hypothetical protein